MGQEMRNLGRCVGLAPLRGEKTQLRENTEGGCSGERFKSSCLERGRSRASRSVRDRGQHPRPGCPIPTSAQCVFSLLGRVFANLGLFGMLLPSLPSCTPGQETPGFGWEPCIPQPKPTAWPARAKTPPWERGNPSLFIVLLFFFIFSALMFLSWDAGLGMGSTDPPFQGSCIPPVLAGQLGRADRHCQPPPHHSHCNSNGFLIKTPNPPILAPACCSVAGGIGLSMGTRR